MSFLVVDIETNSKEVDSAKLKWFGAYSYTTKEYSLLSFTEINKIKELIESHKYIVGFNINNFDIPILKRNLCCKKVELKEIAESNKSQIVIPNVVEVEKNIFDYKIILDLYECLAPKTTFAPHNKSRLTQMGYSLDNYKLKTIVGALGLDEENKGEINYDIFKKDSWSEEEISEIKKYLKQDVEITKKLLDWYVTQFKPLEPMLPKEYVRKLKHLKCSSSSLGYAILCNKVGLPAEWSDEKPENHVHIEGAHRIFSRKELVKGNIVALDFTSQYPHNIMMGNLFSRVEQNSAEQGWNGSGYFNLQGTYNNKELGKFEKAYQEILNERLTAKRAGDKTKSQAFKIVINSIYGCRGNYAFKNVYDPIAAGDCTSMGRTMLRKLAAHLEVNGFFPIYGFTDGIYVLLPEGFDKNALMVVVDSFVKEVKEHVPFPMDSFGLELEKELKLMWIISANCYLYVTNKDTVFCTDTLLNKNTPSVVMKVFEDYIKPKIVRELDVNFTEKELEEQISLVLKNNLELAAEQHKAGNVAEYKVKSSLQYQISEKYGAGEHLLIPNIAGVGVGKDLGTKKRKPLRYCTLTEFKENNLSVSDIDLRKVMDWLEPFLRKSKKEVKK